MGNTQGQPSENNNMEQFYQNYINQQSVLIQQQQQINQLQQQQMQQLRQPNVVYQSFTQTTPNHSSYSNTTAKEKVTSNAFSEDSRRYDPRFDEYMKPTRQLPSTKPKLDPYKILSIDKQYDRRTLKKAYLKAALKTHPDRGGNEEDFQKVSIAYTVLLNKLKNNQSHKNHDELREESKQYRKEQSIDPRFNSRMKDNFDIEVFNKIYEENKLEDPYDDGYGDWLKKRYFT